MDKQLEHEMEAAAYLGVIWVRKTWCATQKQGETTTLFRI